VAPAWHDAGMAARTAQVRLRHRLSTLLLCCVLAAVTGCGTVQRAIAGYPGSGPDAPPGTVRIATGTPEGVYYKYGTALAGVVDSRLPGVHAEVDATEGSVDNLGRVASGRATLAFSAADAAADAATGQGSFRTALPIQAVARVYDDYVHLVVRADSPIHSPADLRGQRVSLGQRGSGTALISRRVLALLGLAPSRDLASAQHLGLTASADALQADLVDAFFWSGGLPTKGITDLAAELPVRLVPLGDLARGMRAHSRTYRAAVVPAGTYPGVLQVQTLAVPDYLVTRAGTDSALVYQLTRVLFESRDQVAATVPIAGVLEARSAIETAPVALHPGALRYYRDTKR
jgi:TRAP transporter TAXI family solute receptor